MDQEPPCDLEQDEGLDDGLYEFDMDEEFHDAVQEGESNVPEEVADATPTENATRRIPTTAQATVADFPPEWMEDDDDMWEDLSRYSSDVLASFPSHSTMVYRPTVESSDRARFW